MKCAAASFADMPEALASTLEVADQCDIKLNLGATLLPPFDVPDSLTPDQYLRQLVLKGLAWRFGRHDLDLDKPQKSRRSAEPRVELLERRT